MKYILVVLSILALPAFSSCQTKADDPNAEFVKQLTQLKEFTRSENRIDSIGKKNNMPFHISFDISASPGLTGDKSGNTLVAFINFDRGMDHIILYTVKFDKKEQKIISVKKEQLGTSLAEYGWTNNTP